MKKEKTKPSRHRRNKRLRDPQKGYTDLIRLWKEDARSHRRSEQNMPRWETRLHKIHRSICDSAKKKGENSRHAFRKWISDVCNRAAQMNETEFLADVIALARSVYGINIKIGIKHNTRYPTDVKRNPLGKHVRGIWRSIENIF